MESKSLLASKTFWFNILSLAAGVAAYIAGAEQLAAYPAVAPIFVAVAGGLNIVIRLFTSKPIA